MRFISIVFVYLFITVAGCSTQIPSSSTHSSDGSRSVLPSAAVQATSEPPSRVKVAINGTSLFMDLGIYGVDTSLASQDALGHLSSSLDEYPQVNRFTLIWHNMAPNAIFQTMVVYDRNKRKLYSDVRDGYYKDHKMGKPKIEFNFSKIADWHIRSGAKDNLSFTELNRRLENR